MYINALKEWSSETLESVKKFEHAKMPRARNVELSPTLDMRFKNLYCGVDRSEYVWTHGAPGHMNSKIHGKRTRPEQIRSSHLHVRWIRNYDVQCPP
jgi:hypothetical protein